MSRFAHVVAGLVLGLTVSVVPAAAGTIDVSFDIKPTSCPNPFNTDLSFEGPSFPTAILGDKGFSANNIDRESLVIVVPGGGGFTEILIPPIDGGSLEDVATPVHDDTQCVCTTEGPDGYVDLTVHFDHDAIEAALGQVSNGQVFQLCIRGQLIDGTPFEGCDCIFIVGPISVDAESWGRVKAGYR